jgi:D-sedoheptulose 7-phosphate isomerase
LLALSTSGMSPNVIMAVERANEIGMTSLAFTGKDGGTLARAASVALIVPHDDFARIQEVHMALGHILCGLVEDFVGINGHHDSTPER